MANAEAAVREDLLSATSSCGVGILQRLGKDEKTHFLGGSVHEGEVWGQVLNDGFAGWSFS